MNTGLRSALKTVVALGVLYALSILCGFALLCGAFRLGLLAQIDILFYRGLVLIGLVAVAMFGVLASVLRKARLPSLGARDAVAACAMSLSFNLAFLVVLPVTVDRSISIFMLGQMAARPGQAMSGEEMTRLFTKVYVSEHRQIERRLREQTLSGFLVKDGDAYRISARGRHLIAMSKIVADLFDSHAGLVDPATPTGRVALERGQRLDESARK